ncbi:MAG TPA: hypothetical protein VIX37_12585 [Candidatus Sulfotelmatobacter sp.]
MPITLRQQWFQVLAAPMERPGEIVAREELRQRKFALSFHLSGEQKEQSW